MPVPSIDGLTLPTTVVGSYAIPSWLWAAYEKIEAGGFGEMDRCVEGVKVERLFYHICFGTLEGFSFSERSDRSLFPAILGVKADQLVFSSPTASWPRSGSGASSTAPRSWEPGSSTLSRFTSRSLKSWRGGFTSCSSTSRLSASG